MLAKKYLFYISQNYSFAILRPLQQAVRERGGEAYWFIQGTSVNKNYFITDEVVLETVEDIILWQPDAVIFPANIAPTFLPGINVAVFHGFDAGKLDRKGQNDHYKVRNCFDLYCTQGPDATEQFQNLAEQHKTFKVLETGWCALDPLFTNNASMVKKDKKHTCSVNKIIDVKYKPTVLMCSTFSKKLSCAPHLFDEVKRLSETGKWNWLIQFHPKMDEKIVNQYKSIQNEYLTYIETDNVIPLLKQADVMLCDTSSVLIMFLLQEKPVVTYNNIAPENYLVNISNSSKLESSIEYALSRPKALIDNIEQYICKTHPYNDGKSSARVLDAIDQTILQKDTLKSKPIDFLRQFKMRKQLNYWKF